MESTYHKNIRRHQGKCQEQAEAHDSMHKRLGEAMKKVDEAALTAADAEAKVDKLEAQAIMERIDADAKVERLEAQVKELQKQLRRFSRALCGAAVEHLPCSPGSLSDTN